jgi:hypothetical protein
MPFEYARARLLFAVIAALVAGCTGPADPSRPQLLGRDQARVGDVSWVVAHADPLNVSPNELEFAVVRVAACETIQSQSIRPRLVIGKPECGVLYFIQRDAGVDSL